MGETISDFLVHQFNPVFSVCLGGTGLIISLMVQFAYKRYVAPVYWSAVVMVAIFGTMAADVLHIGLGIPYFISTVFFSFILAAIFIFWYRTEKTLSIHSIYTTRRELFYWATVMATFALGTAAGDMTASTLRLGYFSSGIIFSVIILIPAVSYFFLRLNEIVSFWFAYIITRPLGASFADWIGRSKNLGGLGFGTGQISLVIGILVGIFVIFLTITRIDVKEYKRG